jgi:fumarate reductase subunit D
MRDVLLLIHPTLGVLGVLASLWVFVEAIRLDPGGLRRMKVASLLAAVLIAATWLAGGLWDAAYFEADQKILATGPWAFFGNTGMEIKEHLFPIILVLALYLPIAVFRGDLLSDRGNRFVVGTVSAFVVLCGLAMEGVGAVLAMSVKVALVQVRGG